MIITPDLVFLNNPRTGTTFARKAISAAYASRVEPVSCAVRELSLPIRRGHGQSGHDQHGTYVQIPACYRGLPVASAVRNPFTLLVAVYELGLWRPSVLPTDPTGELDRHGADAFEYFLRSQELAMAPRWGVPFGRSGFGPLSAHYLQMFAKAPLAAFRAVAQGADDDTVEGHIAPVQFVQQERLAADLCELLKRLEADVDLEAIRHHPPSHVTRRSQVWTRDCFTAEMVDRIEQREAFLFRSLARRGLVYTFDNAVFAQPQRRSTAPAT